MFFNDDDMAAVDTVLAGFLLDISVRNTISHLSAQAAMSPTKFKRCFKFHTGVSVYAFQKTHRLNEAYQWITNRTHPLKRIYKLCGFRYAVHFNDAFTRRFTISPSKLSKYRFRQML